MLEPDITVRNQHYEPLLYITRGPQNVHPRYILLFDLYLPPPNIRSRASGRFGPKGNIPRKVKAMIPGWDWWDWWAGSRHSLWAITRNFDDATSGPSFDFRAQILCILFYFFLSIFQHHWVKSFFLRYRSLWRGDTSCVGVVLHHHRFLYMVFFCGVTFLVGDEAEAIAIAEALKTHNHTYMCACSGPCNIVSPPFPRQPLFDPRARHVEGRREGVWWW